MGYGCLNRCNDETSKARGEGPLSERTNGHSDLVVRAALDASTRSLVPLPAFSSSLSYYDGCVAARGPANLLQGLRGYFGSHTYRRLDAEGSFYTRWGPGRQGSPDPLAPCGRSFSRRGPICERSSILSRP